MKGSYWKCEFCGQKTFDTFPKDWIHLPHFVMQKGKGLFLENYSSASYQDRIEYSSWNNLTFCSMTCFLEWLKKTFGTSFLNNNPSQKKSP